MTQQVRLWATTSGGAAKPVVCDSDGNLVIQLEAATVNVGDVDIQTFPAANLSQRASAASLSVTPATDVTDATYIGDVKFGEALPAGTAVVGKVGIDQTTDGTTNAVHLVAGTALAGKFSIDQVTANANEVVVKSITAGPLPDTSGSDLAGIHSSADTIAGAISSSRMQVDLKGTKGSVTTAHSAITETATSSEIDCSGYNALLVETIVTVAAKNWTVKVTGCLSTGGTFGDCYDGSTLMSYQTNASKIAIWKGIPNFVKIAATEDEDTGTCTVRVQPINI